MVARPELSKEARKAAAKAGTALPNGKYPIRTKRELRAAIKLRHHSREPYPTVKAHILRRAAALGVRLKASQVASAKSLTSADRPGRATIMASSLVAACYDKSCAPPPVGKGGSSKGGSAPDVKLTNGQMRNLAGFAPNQRSGRDWKSPAVLTSAEAKPLVAKGLLVASTLPVPGVRNIGNSKRWELTEDGLEVARRVEYVARGGYRLNARKEFQPITAAEARGDSKPVSAEEFQRLARIGQAKLDKMAENASPIKGLDDNWDQVKRDGYVEVQKSWGGATIDAHTGQALPQGANRYAMTVKDSGDSVSVPQNASEAEFNRAMDQAKERYREILERENHYLGIFHDDDLGRIDIDPVIVVNRLEDVHTIGSATRAIGGAYNFADGNGYWPPHVKE